MGSCLAPPFCMLSGHIYRFWFHKHTGQDHHNWALDSYLNILLVLVSSLQFKKIHIPATPFWHNACYHNHSGMWHHNLLGRNIAWYLYQMNQSSNKLHNLRGTWSWLPYASVWRQLQEASWGIQRVLSWCYKLWPQLSSRTFTTHATRSLSGFGECDFGCQFTTYSFYSWAELDRSDTAEVLVFQAGGRHGSHGWYRKVIRAIYGARICFLETGCRITNSAMLRSKILALHLALAARNEPKGVNIEDWTLNPHIIQYKYHSA